MENKRRLLQETILELAYFLGYNLITMLFTCQRLKILKVLRTSGSINYNFNITIKHATFIYAIYSIQKLVSLAQLVEQ